MTLQGFSNHLMPQRDQRDDMSLGEIGTHMSRVAPFKDALPTELQHRSFWNSYLIFHSLCDCKNDKIMLSVEKYTKKVSKVEQKSELWVCKETFDAKRGEDDEEAGEEEWTP